MIDHFILTRFNIASAGREAPIRNSPGWLERRFDLFERFCLPSVAAQTRTDFKWLIYFDENTPDPFRTRIVEAQKMVPFKALFVGPFAASMAAQDLKRWTDPNSTRVLTTRLDNDDAISRDFFQLTVNAAQRLEDGTIINFPSGVALKRGRVYSATDPSNPFTSLIESADAARSIWAAPHTELAARFPIIQESAEPCWLQVVHGENVTNRIKGRRLSDSAVMNRFALGSGCQLEETGTLALLADRICLAPARTLREALITVAKRGLGRH